MGTDVALTAKSPREEFEENIRARLVKDIGSLIPDAALKEYVDRAIEESFFKDVKDTVKEGWSTKEIIRPAWFVVVCKELLEERVKREVQAWFAANADRVEGMVEAQFKGGIASMVIANLDFHMRSAMGQIAEGVCREITGIKKEGY